MADRRARKIFGNPVPVSKKIRRKIFGNSVPVSKKIRLFFALAFFLPPCFLAGQELSPPESEGSSYIERTGEELRFIQRLVWEKAEYAHRYEITVERENNSGEYTEIYREFRTENFTDLSLAPGLYRYRIQAYNLLDRPAGLSLWIPLRVIPALQPELYSYNQEFLPAGDLRGDVEITLYGRNLVEGAELCLDPADGDAVTPLAYVPSGESARLVFSLHGYLRQPWEPPFGGLFTGLKISDGQHPELFTWKSE